MGDSIGVVITDAVTFESEDGDMKFRGTDRALLREAKRTLERIAARDGLVPTLPPRSRRANIVVIPAEDAELTAAAELLHTRFQTLLDLE